MESFINYLSAISLLSEESQKAIRSKLSKKNYSKNEILIKELSTCQHLFFIKNGLVRAFYFKEGKDITDWFGLENSIIGPIIRNFPVKEGSHAVEVFEDSEIVSISFDDLQILYNTHHEIERLGRIISIQAILLLQQKLDSIQFLTSKERYTDFANNFPQLLQRVPLGHIASYLGMNQVTLSRARKK